MNRSVCCGAPWRRRIAQCHRAFLPVPDVDVYLVPIGPTLYELYCESVEAGDTESGAGAGAGAGRGGWYARFRHMVAEAQDARRARHLARLPSDPHERRSWLVRLRDVIIGWVAEALVDWRMLWHLRSRTTVDLIHPGDMQPGDAVAVARAGLQRDADRHVRRLVGSSVAAAILGPLLFFVPGPNLIAYYFVFLAVGHLLAWRGARHGLTRVEWRPQASVPLTELRGILRDDPEVRAAHVRDVAARLKLEHLAPFVERMLGRLLVFTLLAIGCATPAAAQVVGGPRPAQTAEPQRGFLTRYAAHVEGARLSGKGDRHFSWDSDLGVDMDVFDLRFARGNIYLNMETVVGGERRPIDPRQTAYTIDLSVFARVWRGELGVTFHHVSRHRTDRENLGAPAWNMLGLSYGNRWRAGRYDLDLSGRWMQRIASSDVDYEQEFNGSFRVLRRVNDRVSLIGELDAVALRTDPRVFGRRSQLGGVVQVGVRIRGGIGAGELLIGRERRIDPDIYLLRPAHWTRLAFRFVLD